jgi:hypothetical protein
MAELMAAATVLDFRRSPVRDRVARDTRGDEMIERARSMSNTTSILIVPDRSRAWTR